MKFTKLATLLAIAVGGAGLVATAASQPSWLGIQPGSVEVQPLNGHVTKLSLAANATVPMDTSALAGFGWFYETGDNTVFAITTHEGVRDSTQNPDNWHPHNVLLGDAPETSKDNVDADLCIDRISDAPFANVALQQDGDVRVNARNSVLTGDVAEKAAAFEIVVDKDCPITEPTKQLVPGGIPLGIVLLQATT